MLLIAFIASQAFTGSPIVCKRTIDLEPYSSPVPNLKVPTVEQSITLLEKRPDNYPKRDLETARKRKRSKFLNRQWIDPETRKKHQKQGKTPQILDISDDDDLLDTQYAAFLTNTGDNIS